MDSMSYRELECEAIRAQANREELIERIVRAIPEDGNSDPLKGLRLYRASAPTELVHGVFDLAFCLIRPGKQGGPCWRPPLPLRPLSLPSRRGRAARREPGPRSVEGTAVPEPAPYARFRSY